MSKLIGPILFFCALTVSTEGLASKFEPDISELDGSNTSTKQYHVVTTVLYQITVFSLLQVNGSARKTKS